MRSLFGLWIFSLAAFGSPCPALPARYDIEKLTYRLEKIASSVSVEILFPKLSRLAQCSTRSASFGTVWEWEIDSSEPLNVSVRDRNNAVVQTFVYTGSLTLRVNSSRATLNFSSLVPSKPLFDHQLFSVEVSSDAPVCHLPCFDLEDSGTRRHLSGAQVP